MTSRPTQRPRVPHFSSGPCAKRPGWTPAALADAALGRSHRSPLGKAKLGRAIDLTRAVLQVPAEYRIGIVPASDTGAVEMAMWTMLGPKPVEVAAWEAFGKEWVTDALKQLKIAPRIHQTPYGILPDLAAIDTKNSDVVFTWNGTAAGVKVPDGDWIAADRAGLTICDATSAAFAQPLPWDKLDVVTFSWQKVMGGEAAHGMLILSPRAVARLESHTPSWPLPKIFRLTKDGKLIEGIFKGDTINTPSMLAVEDYLDTLDWAERIGGLKALHARADANAKVVYDWVARTPWIAPLAADPATYSNTGVCLVIADPDVLARGDAAVSAFAAGIVERLDREGVALDIGAYRDAPAGLRIWCGATVETSDLEALTPWLDWAFAEEKAALTRAA
ncbi:phosphoserine aminotransferase [Methylobacterium sp. PvP062]|jgi:phosphoserine aminotransferase|uniref:phosphoserine transaminase n=1 Tax=Methylobacterium radiotolerans TaxID=31998 RepID=A0ABV2NJQ1_9HYPH|nr:MULTISPECIES: phosphoserine transaminase [Methylobacterium]MCX7331092.1 phosphoserine transaminase [Hyphomicrobiales bacterium]KIU31169.1 phosphoserine aminotransferase [Methylobacterium radiotolerans]MBP2496615.1 phosphoserine aminotransferase [Methylobacterium sp. PvP105]MBP2503514.1 phosphoserine aminotransferase [Methylobacterium sp. PvP109]UIY40474.1 phosphoserine transaminase [Methylobacterium radiotolerans]